MSATIDEKVVEMRFDNKQFESNAKESIGTIEKLKQVLNFSDTTKNFDNLQNAANKVDMNGLGNAVESVKMKFSALEVMAITALTNITNRAVNAGIQLAKSLSVDQISAGFGEYELKMGSIQTIMASTGESLATVNDYLEELNHYADKTIYSFSDMTNNIGKFTNAGVKLEDAVKAIQGISNEAAVSGANANEASRAMYNFAQALSAGYVKLIDWKSIENANMATVEFKQALLDTAVALGTVVQEGDKYRSVTTDANGKVSELFNSTMMFNDSLSSQWMTTEVLVQTLGNYSTDIREMTDAEREAYEEKLRSIGYTEEQIKKVEDLGQKAFDAAQDVKTFSQLMDTLKESVGSGWAQTFELLIGDFEEAKSLWTNVNNVIGDILQQQADARNDLIKGWKDAGGRDALMQGIANSWRGIVAIIKPIKEAFTDIFPPATVVQVVNLTKGFQNFTEKLTISEETSDKLKRTFTGLFSAMDIVRKVAKSFFEILFPGVKIIGGFADNLLTVTAALGDWVTNLNKSLDENKTFEKSVDKIRNVVDLAFTKFKDFLGVIKEWTDSHFKAPDLSFITDFTDTVETRFSPLKTLFNITKKVTTSIVQVFKKSAPILVTIASAIGNALSSLGSRISEAFTTGGFNAVLDLFNSGILAAIGLNVVDFVKNLSSVANEGKGFIEGLSDIKEAIVDTFGAIQSQLKAKALLSIAGAIGILTASLVVLSLIDSDKLTTSLGAITAIFIELFAAMGVYSKVADTKKVNMGGLITFALSVGILSTALLVVSKIPVRDLISGLTGIAGLAVVLDASIILLQQASSKYKAGKLKGLMSFAISIGLLTIALKNVTDIPVKDLISGMVGITSLAAVMDVSIIALQKSSSKYKKGSIKGLMSFAVSIGLLTIVLNNVTDIPVKDLISGLTGITALAVIMDASIILMQAASSKYKEGSIKGLISFAVSLGLLTISLNSVSKIPVKDLISGLTGITALATVMGVTLGALTAVSSKYNPASMLAVAASLTVMATSILVLTPALKILGNMEISEMVKSIGMLAAAFAVLGGAALILSPLTPVILSLSGALALLGIGLAGIGAGILAFSAGMSTLSLMSMTAATTAVATLQIIILGFLDTIANSGEAFGKAIKTLVLTLCDVIVSCVPAIVDTIMVVIKNIVKSLAENTPEIVHYILEFIIGTLNALSADMPEVIKAVVNLVMSIFDGVIDALKGLSTSGLTKGIAGIALLSGLMVALSAMASLAPSAMVGVLAMGAVIAELTIVLAAIGALSKIPGLNWLIGEGADLLENIGVAIGKFVGGIVGGFGSGISSQFPKIGSDLAQFMENVQPFIEGAKSMNTKAMDGVKMLAETVIVLTAADILEGLTSWFTGKSSITEFGKELSEFGPYFNSYYESIKNIDGQVVTASANAALALAEMAKNLPNQGGIVSWFAGENSLATFAEELTEFGPKLKAYSDSIKGLDAKVVIDSSNAALALAEMAKNLPNQGGIVSWFTGDNKISDFGKELAEFGPVLKKYADSVRGLDANVVKASTNAALALSEMAKDLPNKGGIVSWFVGDNTLSDFGEELTKFGPKLKAYSNSISGIKTDIVSKSATAASSLSKMASELPNKGGIVTWFVGDNTLSDFGKELAEFGPYISKYSSSIAGVKSDAITASANAAKSLSELANNLPNSGGLFSLFTGNKGISKFGKDLVKFGSSISDYYDSISGINATLLGDVINQVKKILEIVMSLKDVDSSMLRTFGDDLKKMGKNGMSEFIEAFKEAGPSLEKEITQIAKTITTTFNENLSENQFKELGTSFIDSFIKGMTSKKPDIETSLNSLANFIITNFSNSLTNSDFYKLGSNISTGLGSGITESSNIPNTAVLTLSDQIMSQATTSLATSKFYTVGGKAAKGIGSGITDSSNAPKSAITSLSDLIMRQASSSLAASKFYNVGSNATNSLGTGITSSVNSAKTAISWVADWIMWQTNSSLAASKFYNVGSNASSSIGSGIGSQMSYTSNVAANMGNAVANAISGIVNYNNFYGIGSNVGSGLSGGINSTINSIANAAINAASAAVNAAKKMLGIHSPSKVFAEIGQNVSVGMANGILDKLSNITSAGNDLSDTVINPVQEALKRISGLIDSDSTDYNPVITPTIDLSNVTDGFNQITGLFNGLNLSTTMDLAQAASSGFYKSTNATRESEERERRINEKLDRLLQSSREEPRTENHNNFYIQSSDPKQAAEEVGYIMQHKIERGRAAWAK